MMSPAALPALDTAALDALLSTNRPRQLDLLTHVARRLIRSDVVTHLLVRGSLARGTSDRLSDVDLVVGIDETAYTDYLRVADALIRTDIGAILPGWRDTIVPPMGGVGYVYLVEHDDKLHQLDLYLAPAGRVDDIAVVTAGRAVYTRPAWSSRDLAGADTAASEAAAAVLREQPTCTELLVEALVLAWMIRKRISRGQRFMAYAETHMLVTAARALVRTALDPTTAYYGWYHLDTDIGATPLGRACLQGLHDLIGIGPVPAPDRLTELVDRVVTLARLAAPSAVDDLRLSIDAFLHHYGTTG